MTEQEREELKRKNMNGNQKTCSGCGSVIPANYDVCPVCGIVLRQDIPVQRAQQGYQVVQSSNEQGKGLAIASLVLGCVGILFSLFGILCVLGLICGIAGLITAKKAKKNGCMNGIRTAGLILSIIATVLGAIGSVVVIIFVFASLLQIIGYDIPDGKKTIDELGRGTGAAILSMLRMYV